MNLQYYYNYIAIVEEGSLTAAARKLHIAQPALSNQVKTLEQIYGTRLFFRGARKLELTDAGQILYRKAKRMCEMEIEAKSEIASGFTGTRGTLKLGVSSSVLCMNLYTCLNKFVEQYPEVNLQIVEREHDELIRMILNGSIDVIVAQFVGEPKENFDVVFRTEDVMVAAYSKDKGYFANSGDFLTAEDFDNVPLALLKTMVNPLKSTIKRAGCEPYFRCICNRIQSNLQMARHGHAVAVTALRVLSDLDYLDLEFKPIEAGVMPVFSMNFITAQPRYRSPIVNNFIRCYADHYNLPMPDLSVIDDE